MLYDSLGKTRPTGICITRAIAKKKQMTVTPEGFDTIFGFLWSQKNAIFSGTEWEQFTIEEVNCPAQSDGYNCGFYTIAFVESYIRGKTINNSNCTTQHMHDFRFFVAHHILNRTSV